MIWAAFLVQETKKNNNKKNKKIKIKNKKLGTLVGFQG